MNVQETKEQLIAELIRLAFAEDIGDGDHTTLCCIPATEMGKSQLIVKEDGVLAGVEMAERIFHTFDPDLKMTIFIHDGAEVKKGDIAFVVEGKVQSLLQTERLMLNVMQRMSGIATYTNNVAALLKGTNTKLLDTRKTTPCMRIFEKYAVRAGGGNNHRYNLSDAVMLKDNHIDAAGGVARAIQMAREYASFVCKIEVETENLDMVREAVEAGADIIMLDNMSPELMAEAIKIIDGRAKTECSGNITKENIETITKLGVDYVSSGALTHSAPILDISLKHLHPVD